MNQSFLVKNYLIENERKVNSIVRWFPMAFLLLCPVLLIAERMGMFRFELMVVIELCIGIAVLALFPAIFVRYCYNEIWNRCVCLTVLELLVCLMACNDVVDITLAFCLVPLISILYVDRTVFFHTIRNCFIAMLVVQVGSIVYNLQMAAKYDVSYEVDYMLFVGLVLEYWVVAIVLYVILLRYEEMVASGYKIEHRSDGTYTTAAVVIQEQQTEESYNAKGVFLEVEHKISGLLRSQAKTFRMDIDTALPSLLKGDPEKVKLALVNLLSDFVQYTQSGEVSVEVTYEKGITPKKGQNITVVCKITCTEDLSEDLRYGNALGFALAKNMIQKLNGVILNKSGGNPYCTHYVISFQQMVDSEETIAQMRQTRKKEQDMLIWDSRKKAENLMYVKKGKALIVDDSEVNQKLVAAILKSYGLDSVCVSSGDEAVAIVQSKEFNLVILDYMMPIKGGLQIAKEIRQLGEPYYEELPLIAMTSSNTEENKMMFYDNRFAEVISKPIKEDELRLAIALCMCL